ncbi:helix-turn-helix transcriptional regulator [Paraferrimonas sp. SM1919]|uniref:helix-turn-helix domain-containing protein n=1 Tax=Paraferrimonas sp. SM1919 TaxID=2662263 RepID=UPI0013D3328C|nr:helix-turn-helix transcriptional regulator [Paraferrimonas sp. SM1919]
MLYVDGEIDPMNWAKVIETCGNESFFEELAIGLHQASSYESVVVFEYIKGKQPNVLFHDLEERYVQPALNVFLQGGYLLDPFVIAIDKGIESGLYRLKDLAPDDFFTSEYYLSYYQGSGLKDEINIIARISDEKVIIISLGLRQHTVNSNTREFQYLCKKRPILIAFLKKHIDLLSQQSEVEENDFDSQLSIAFNNFGRDVLSEREREIILLILKGYSSKAIAGLLEISPDTVKVHRKRIHRKLDITSQAELFSLFLSSLSMIKHNNDADPLALYLAEFELPVRSDID